MRRLRLIDQPRQQLPPAASIQQQQRRLIQAGDAAGFARALGIEQPSPAFLAAANAAGSPFDPNASGPWPENFWLGKPKT
jgi:hypothetical protein